MGPILNDFFVFVKIMKLKMVPLQIYQTWKLKRQHEKLIDQSLNKFEKTWRFLKDCAYFRSGSSFRKLPRDFLPRIGSKSRSNGFSSGGENPLSDVRTVAGLIISAGYATTLKNERSSLRGGERSHEWFNTFGRTLNGASNSCYTMMVNWIISSNHSLWLKCLS